MKTIELCPEGEAISDFQAEERARKFLSSEETAMKVSSEIFIYVLRVLIREKLYPHDQVKFLFKGTEMSINEDGRLDFWAEGFCSTWDKCLNRLLM